MTTELSKLPSSTVERIWTPDPVPPGALGGIDGGGGVLPPPGTNTNDWGGGIPRYGSSPSTGSPPNPRGGNNGEDNNNDGDQDFPLSAAELQRLLRILTQSGGIQPA